MITANETHRADAGASGTSRVPAAHAEDMDLRLLIKAQEMVHVGTWAVIVDPANPQSLENVLWSDEMFRISGLTPRSFNPSFAAFMSTVHPDDRERIGSVVANAIQTRSPYSFDYRIATADGSLKVLHGRGSLELNERGDVVRILGTCVDVTDRFRAQQELAESEARLRAVFDQSAVGMVVAERDGTMKQVNRSFANLLGYSIDELLGRTLWEITYPDDQVLSVKTSGTSTIDRPVTYEKRYVKRDGSVVWARVTASRMQLEGRPDAFIGVVEDIDEHKRANQALERQTEILRGMLDHLPVMVLRLDHNGRLIYSNCEAQRLFGWSKSEMPSDIISAAFPDREQADHARKMLAAGSAEWLDLEPRAQDGRVVPSSWAALSLSDGESLVIGQDLTERRHMQQSLAQAQKLEAVGQLAGGVAHDFNNLLTVISAGASFVQDAAGDNATIASDAQDILAACSRAASLTRQLLAFSRRQMLQPEILNINDVIQGLSKTLSRLLGEHIELDVQCGAQLPSVEVDRHQIEQVILNLSVNARDAIKEHGTITIATRNTPDQLGRTQLQIEVSDDGCGIPADVMKKMFEPFFTTKPVGKGTGLGLATVHGIVEQSGGRCAVESVVGSGTTFRVYLPVVDAVQLSPRPKVDMSVEGGAETILLVEDENAVRAITRRMLTQLGYTVVEARHGKDGLDLASDRNLKIDLLVTDVVMPEMGGRELVAALREMRPGLPVLYVSGYTDDELLRRGILDPGVRLMRKPFSRQDLARVVRALLTGAAPKPSEVLT